MYSGTEQILQDLFLRICFLFSVCFIQPWLPSKANPRLHSSAYWINYYLFLHVSTRELGALGVRGTSRETDCMEGRYLHNDRRFPTSPHWKPAVNGIRDLLLALMLIKLESMSRKTWHGQVNRVLKSGHVKIQSNRRVCLNMNEARIECFEKKKRFIILFTYN